MDKQQQQIEEVERSCKDCMHYEICSLWTTTDRDEDEAYKYCFGRYRPKIPENAVVLTEEEYERLLKEETLCERLGNVVDVKLKYIYELEDKVAQERKEMAEKIYNMAEEVVEKTKYIVDGKLYLHIDVLKLIIEQLGVDLGEKK